MKNNFYGETGDKKMREDTEAREERRKNQDYSPVVNVSLSGTPRMGRVSELEPGQGFWERRNNEFHIVIGPNCFTELILSEENKDKKYIVVYHVYKKLISTVPADEWVVMANKIEINVS